MLITGAVRFKINGLNLGRLVDRLTSCGITLYNIEKPSGKTLTFYVTIKDSKKVIAQLENLCYNYSTQASGALPLIKKLVMRAGLLAGIVLFAVGAVLSGYFVSEIRVSGCKDLHPHTILQSVRETGVREGSFGRVSCDSISRHVIASHDRIAYAWTTYKGVILYVNIVETPPAPVIIDTKPCDIVSQRAGTVSRLLVYQGTPLVKAGDTVNKGDVLIAGYHESPDGQRYPVKAMGEVYGNTSITYTQTFYCKKQVLSPTGKKQVCRYIELFGQLFPAKPKQAKFSSYTTESEYSYIFYNNFLPARLFTVTYHQMEVITLTEDFEKVKRIIIDEAEQKAASAAAKEGRIIEMNTQVKDAEDIKYIQTIITIEKSFL